MHQNWYAWVGTPLFYGYPSPHPAPKAPKIFFGYKAPPPKYKAPPEGLGSVTYYKAGGALYLGGV